MSRQQLWVAAFTPRFWLKWPADKGGLHTGGGADDAREGVRRRVLHVVVGVEGALVVKLRHGPVRRNGDPLGEVAGVQPVEAADRGIVICAAAAMA